MSEVYEELTNLEIERDMLQAENERLREELAVHGVEVGSDPFGIRKDAERWRKACQILESETGDIELRIWTDNGDVEMNGAWNYPYTKAEADEAIDAARKGET